ncbi:MAG: Response regulator receiver and domain protein [Friedmanniella sp.]|nr:Response regulator receiver and domain protein [Friedmanniella sp.]
MTAVRVQLVFAAAHLKAQPSAREPGFGRPVGKASRTAPAGTLDAVGEDAEKAGLVSVESSGDERAWAADKRDFVGDRRDELADGREKAADARERAADRREAAFDQRDQELGTGTAEPGSADEHASFAPAATPADLAAERESRDGARSERTRAAADREEATKLREADASPTRLAMVFADLAQQLYSADSMDDVFAQIAEAAVSTMTGCQMASVTLSEPSGYRTAATTHEAATAVDRAQYEAEEGPCLDAVNAPTVYAESFPDDRWPALGSRPTESGVQSVLSSHVATEPGGPVGAGGGSLNSYGVTPDAFDDTAQEIGLILAAHASVAARAVEERSTLQSLHQGLEQALLSRDVIGQAKGILMERLKLTPEDAFDLLRRSSQHLNVKLRDVASRVAETGELKAKGHRPADRPQHS